MNTSPITVDYGVFDTAYENFQVAVNAILSTANDANSDLSGTGSIDDFSHTANATLTANLSAASTALTNAVNQLVSDANTIITAIPAF